MGILFNSTALGIHFCETSLIFNFKTRLGGEICLCDVNMYKGYFACVRTENYSAVEIKPKSRVCDLRSLSISIANGMICSDIWHKYHV